MKKAMIVVAVAVIVGVILFAGTTLAQQNTDRGNGLGGERFFGGQRNGAGPQGEGAMVEGRHHGPAARMGRMLYIAAAAPWCKDNAEVQALVDKIVAGRKVMIKNETDRLAAFEKLLKAARADDKEAMKAAHEQMKTVNEKFKTDLEALTGDLRKLAGLLRELRPERTEGAGNAEGGMDFGGEFDDF